MKILLQSTKCLRGASMLVLIAGMAFSQTATDNTKINRRDQTKGAVTADRQKMNGDDRKLTQTIRKAVIADKSLSMYAHNVKIVSMHGTVTLKGPVRSDEEKRRIVAMAVNASGSADTVIDQLTVEEPKSK